MSGMAYGVKLCIYYDKQYVADNASVLLLEYFSTAAGTFTYLKALTLLSPQTAGWEADQLSH